MPVKLFKDFNKDTKDLLTKQYLGAGEWKLESKIKPEDRVFILNPGWEIKKNVAKLSVDVDYNIKEYSLKTKTTVSSDNTIKPKLTWEQGPRKVEFTLNNLSADSNFEAVYEDSFPCNAAIYDKLTRTGGEIGVSYGLPGDVAIGAGASFEYPTKLKSWSAGFRATRSGYIVNVTTEALNKYVTGVFAPLKIGGVSLKAGAQVTCGGGKFDAVVGVEAPVSDFTVKAKINADANLTVALVRKFADKWTAALTVSLNDAPKFGLNLTRE